MVNKQGWLRIVEALVSILIIIGAVLVVLSYRQAESPINSLCSLIPGLLDEIAKNNSLRENALSHQTTVIKIFVDARIANPGIASRVSVCGPVDEIGCALNESGLDNLDICAGERLISALPAQETINPQRVKVFLFRAQAR